MPSDPTNILFLFTDDQRFDAVAALGDPAVRTPNLDRLVRRGTAMTHCFIQGSTVPAVCICSRATLIQGRSLYRSPQQPPANHALWPEAFRSAGYRTFGTGKWHNGPAAYARCFDEGQSIFFGGMSNHLQVPIHDFDPSGEYPKSQRHIARKFSSELFSDAAVDFLRRQRNKRKPFFAFISYTAPHDPRMAPETYEDIYRPHDERVPVPRNYLPEHPFDNGELSIRDERLAPFPRTVPEVRKHIAGYYAMVTHLDEQIGRVLDALDQSGRADETLIVFAGDNGLAVGQHGLLGKQNMYDHSVRVPLVFAGAGIERGKTIDAPVYLHELFATTCELSGVGVPDSVETASFAPLLRGDDDRARQTVYAGYRDGQRMVRDRRWKYIHYPEIDRVQLFDVVNDSWETADLSGRRRFAGVLRRLEGELKRRMTDTGYRPALADPKRH